MISSIYVFKLNMLFIFFLIPFINARNILLYNDTHVYNISNYKSIVKIPADLSLVELSDRDIKKLNIIINKNITTNRSTIIFD